METFSLYELNEHIRRVIALNFEDPVWVRCEIAQIKEARGHHYLELIEKDDEGDQIKAQSAAVIWSRQISFIRRKCGDVVQQVLQAGVEIRIRVRVDYNERYGLKLMIEDLDPSYTLGNLELKRREVLQILHREGLIGKNATLPIPAVVQRIAVLSNRQAAGYQDFLHHLRSNAYAYRFELDLVPVAVQGQRVEAEVSRAIREISKAAGHYDCIVLIRGGGSRIDLSGFDNLEIGRAIGQCPLPVFTGIGHEIDQSVA
ncbi:MAG: exodeoxyribonuclease VII large subunit, partial [Saprospiraceae bacterium]|nr:exodeoxyribonuclease VII large subunit [Saprospiraceae bacterium]